MCGAEFAALPDGVQRVAAALRQSSYPRAAFKLCPQDRERLTRAPVADVVEQVAS